MPFETFKRQRVRPGDEPYLTIQRKGIFSLNRPAFEALDRPDWVELLYDSDTRRIGVRKVDSSIDHAYGVRKLGSRRGESTFLVSGTAFTNYYEIDTSRSIRRSGRVEDGVFMIDLNDPGTEVTSNRSRQRDASDEEHHSESDYSG
jgi:hypothetical protein